jgi:hypothetical protein
MRHTNHDFDIVFTVLSEHSDSDKIPDGEILKALRARVDSLAQEGEIREAASCYHSFEA